MPNWCSNNLNVYGSKEAVREFVAGIKLVDNEPCLLESFLPVPEDSKSDWYNWSIANWGCKWSDSNTDMTHTLDRPTDLMDDSDFAHFFFQTPWAPPEAGIKTISAMFPKLTFVLSYTEEGMGFYGATSFFNGEVAAEAGGDCSDIEGMDDLNDLADDEEPDYDEMQSLIDDAVDRCVALVKI